MLNAIFIKLCLKDLKSKGLNICKVILNKTMEIKPIKLNKSSIHYDDELDILTLSIKDNVNHSINIEDIFLIHLDDKNKIVGFEIFHPNKLFGYEKEMLSNLESAKISYTVKDKGLFIQIQLISKYGTVSPPIVCIPENKIENIRLAQPVASVF